MAKLIDMESKNREKIGIFAGIVGIVSNLLLVLIKIGIGLFSNSISILADAMNNLSDIASSVLTIAGFSLASKPADAQHPYGHARYEYISGLFVSLIVLFLGFEFLRNSWERILSPNSIKMNLFLIIVLLITIIIKILQGVFNYKMGKKIDSLTLLATAKDSMSDVFITSVVLISALIEYFLSWQVDGYIGCFVAGFIIISGVKSLFETIDELLGKLPSEKEIIRIEKKLAEFKGVLGFHDLMVHSYGVNKLYATVHAEVDASIEFLQAHELIDQIENDFLRDLCIHLLIHMDPVIIDNQEIKEMVQVIEGIVRNVDEELSIHDVRISLSKEHPKIIFDLVLKEGMDEIRIKEKVIDLVQRQYPKSIVIIHIDLNYIELNIEK